MLRATHDAGMLVERAHGGPAAHILSGISQGKVCIPNICSNFLLTIKLSLPQGCEFLIVFVFV